MTAFSRPALRSSGADASASHCAGEDAGGPDEGRLAERVADAIRHRGWTAATAESLTGGQIAARLAAAPESSAWFRGAVVAYATEVKQQVLRVPDGPVISGECAGAMATEVRRLLGADLAVAVTGVGGPDEQEGQPPGTVWFGLARPDGSVHTEQRMVPGEPPDIVGRTTRHALELLLEACASPVTST